MIIQNLKIAHPSTSSAYQITKRNGLEFVTFNNQDSLLPQQ